MYCIVHGSVRKPCISEIQEINIYQNIKVATAEVVMVSDILAKIGSTTASHYCKSLVLVR